MTKQGKLLFLGLFLLIVVAAILIFAVDWTDLKMKKEIRNTIAEQEVVKARATEALKAVVSIANELSSWKYSPELNFHIVDTDGRSANFGIVQWVDDVKGERIVEEHFVLFEEIVGASRGNAEVDLATNSVVAMHRSTPDGFKGELVDEPEKIARQFVESVYPKFTEIESTLTFEPGSKTAPGAATNHFFRWNDKQFAAPNGLDMDIPPFIQVGITANGIIFSYDNTVELYRNLPREDLRTLCGFIEMPKTDDSSTDREKGIVKVYFTEDEPFQNRYLILPYELENDFEGCSESAKEFLRHLPNDPK